MQVESPALAGTHVRLEPLSHHHVPGLAAASSGEASLYQWSPVPRGELEAARYVQTAIEWRNAGTAVPFAIVRQKDGTVLGASRFFNIERWAWPEGHARHGNPFPDACEIATRGTRIRRSAAARTLKPNC